jgi:hypothetical protein
VAEALRREAGIDVQVVDGDKGECAVLVDGQPVAKKGAEHPPVEEVVAAGGSRQRKEPLRLTAESRAGYQ